MHIFFIFYILLFISYFFLIHFMYISSVLYSIIFALSMERTWLTFHCWLYTLYIMVYVTNTNLESWKVLEVERHYYVAALKVSEWLFSLKPDFVFFRQFISNHSCRHEVISQHFFLTLTSCKCDIYLQQFNNKKLILWYILDKILSDFAKLCTWKYYL